jgi:hypothetical protein
MGEANAAPDPFERLDPGDAFPDDWPELPADDWNAGPLCEKLGIDPHGRWAWRELALALMEERRPDAAVAMPAERRRGGRPVEWPAWRKQRLAVRLEYLSRMHGLSVRAVCKELAAKLGGVKAATLMRRYREALAADEEVAKTAASAEDAERIRHRIRWEAEVRARGLGRYLHPAVLEMDIPAEFYAVTVPEKRRRGRPKPA